MPGFGLFQEPAVTQLPEIVHHRALADVLQFLTGSYGRFRIEGIG